MNYPLHSQKDLQGEQHLLLQLAKPRHLMGKHFGNTLMRAAQFQTSFPPNVWSDFDEDIFLLCSFLTILMGLTPWIGFSCPVFVVGGCPPKNPQQHLQLGYSVDY